MIKDFENKKVLEAVKRQVNKATKESVCGVDI